MVLGPVVLNRRSIRVILAIRPVVKIDKLPVIIFISLADKGRGDQGIPIVEG
jgi:hypothetical protein